MMLSLLVASLVVAASPTGDDAAATLRTAREVAAHVNDADRSPPRVDLEAVVTFQDSGGTIFLRDDTGATFVTDGQSNPRVEPGRRLRIEGIAYDGLCIGGIRKRSLTLLEQGPAPEPRPITLPLMESGSMHYDWVSLEGVGREIVRTGETSATLVLACGDQGDREVEVRFDRFPTDAPPPLVDARLRVAGQAAGDANDRRQLIRPYIHSRGVEDVTVLDPAPARPFDEPSISFAEVGRRRAAGRRVRIEGVVTAVNTAGGLFLHDGAEGIFVEAPGIDAESDRPVQVGDRVAAIGFPAMGVFSASLSRGAVAIIGRDQPPAPVELAASRTGREPDSEPVLVETEVLQREDAGGSSRLVARSGPLAIRVVAAEILPAEMAQGARVRVRGVCRVAATEPLAYRARVTAYDVFPADAAAVELLAGVPWWTPQRIAIMLTGALVATAGAGLLAAAWAFALNRQVASQLAVIERQLQDEAVVEERRRIAREFHDSLEQDLAGLSLRLDAAASCAADSADRNLFGQFRSLVARLQAETRQFVWDLRDPDRSHWTFEALLAEQIADQQALSPVPIRLAARGGPVRLAPRSRYHLLRIVREAVANAWQHAGGSSIDVTISADDDRIVALVADDGAGFDPAAGERAVGHFGIRGMRERARRIGGTLTIESRPGGGTRVSVSVPAAHGPPS